jgi:hypothetical protein
MGRKRDTVRQRDDINRRRGALRREKGGDDVSWADANLTRPKNKKIHTVDSADTNGQ